MADFDVDEWWAGLTDAERDLAQRHRDNDYLPLEVVRQLNVGFDTDGPMMADDNEADDRSRWFWMPTVQGFLHRFP